MSRLDDIRQTWPEQTAVQHRGTGATGVITPCPLRDPIARDRRVRPTPHLLLNSSDPGVVWVRWDDQRPGCWMRPAQLRKIRARGRTQ
ncbi:hypothetical protein FHS43_006229 [Streptosporangium becharense]|uniref:DUF1918 domain-containing protein n=1 Tax=Streptosporangium becharense TaxID=1816182 RepID=A0A7W9MGL8_9ACTN|nr:hypothetical protein [Streptosporangium becharense]MBB2914917.1 hypothetical protein [Streptosporangium becharense]MBB5820272.1 hypothetical protein [Streptosporangium becharense]